MLLRHIIFFILSFLFLYEANSNGKFPIEDNTLFLSGKDLTPTNIATFNNLIEQNPDLVIDLDISKGGLVNNDGILKITKDNLPEKLQHLKIRDIEGVVRSIGDSFLANHQYIKTCDILDLSCVNLFGNFLFFQCFKLEDVKFPQTQGSLFIGSNFLGECKNLKNCDLSGFMEIHYICSHFLFQCNNLEHLNIKTLSPIFIIDYVGFLKGNNSINNIVLPDFLTCDLKIINERKIIKFARIIARNENQIISAYGESLLSNYKKFKESFIGNINDILSKLNTKVLRAIAPSYITDIKEVSDDDVVNFFKKYFNKLDDIQWVEDSNSKNKSNTQKLIENMFMGRNYLTAWSWYNNPINLMQIKFGLKHFVFNLRNESEEDIKSYVSIIYHAFNKCQSRQGMELNNILVKLGVGGQSVVMGKYSILFHMINEAKMDAFKNLEKDESFLNIISGDNGSSHIYSSYLTTIKNKFGVPIPLKAFNETIKETSNNMRLDAVHHYLKYFNEEKLILMVKSKINELLRERIELEKIKEEIINNKIKLSELMKSNRKNNKMGKKRKRGNQQENLIKKIKKLQAIIDESKLTKCGVSTYIFRDIMYDFIKASEEGGNIDPIAKFNQIRGDDKDSISTFEDLESKPLNQNEVRYLLEKLAVLNTDYHKQIHGESSKILDVIAFKEEFDNEINLDENNNQPTMTQKVMTFVNNSLAFMREVCDVLSDWFLSPIN